MPGIYILLVSYLFARAKSAPVFYCGLLIILFLP